MSIWNLHKKFQLSSAMGLRDFDLQSQPTLMGGNPLIVVQCDEKGKEKCTSCLAKLLDIALFSIGGENTHILPEFSFSVG